MKLFLDTHTVVWLHDGFYERFSDSCKALINSADELLISPMVELELQYLHEIKRIKCTAEKLLGLVNEKFYIEKRDVSFNQIIKAALSIHWTRDPFDRLIVAQAKMEQSKLVSADKNIQKHYKFTII